MCKYETFPLTNEQFHILYNSTNSEQNIAFKHIIICPTGKKKKLGAIEVNKLDESESNGANDLVCNLLKIVKLSCIRYYQEDSKGKGLTK